MKQLAASSLFFPTEIYMVDTLPQLRQAKQKCSGSKGTSLGKLVKHTVTLWPRVN